MGTYDFSNLRMLQFVFLYYPAPGKCVRASSHHSRHPLPYHLGNRDCLPFVAFD
jgi:hypothetical protein